jgi:sigma-B regulation protein RsbU (phosphoserine phosphatase)
MMLIFYRVLKKRLIKPIRDLTRNAEKMVGNLERDEALKMDIHTNDELETLADAFTKMDADLREYIAELSEATTEREKITAELNIAAGIQEGMLPKLTTEFSENTVFDLSAAMIPAKEVGGDFYDFFMIDDTHIALVMADVSGKGIPGSLFMAVSKLLIKNSVKEGDSPAEALRKVNERLMEGNEMEMFVTVWLAIIDLETGEGVAANAGHEHPALRHKDGLFEMVKYKHSLALATFKGLKFKEHEFRIEPGDTIFVYTDGVTEAEDIDENFFGEARLVEALNVDADAMPDELIRNVRSAIWDFRGSAAQFDDITMLAFRYNSK